MKENKNHPESLMMSHGYDPKLSEGAIKCPIFQTSTFAFNSAEEGKAYFELAYGLREKEEAEQMGLIYSRLNNPDLEILENRLTLWDNAEECVVFESGMAAISTVLLEFLSPGDYILYSKPTYGGTDHFINEVLSKYGIKAISFSQDDDEADIMKKIDAVAEAGQLGMIYIETPANPTNALIDIDMCRRMANSYSSEDRKVLLSVDNTYMGPLWQHPLKHGADIVLYSATKFIGGHSDVIAGAVLGSSELMSRVRGMRTFLGNQTSPNTGWLLMRSLETLKLRMDKQAANAEVVADYLKDHPKVDHVYYIGHLDANSKQGKIATKQCEGFGAMVSFDIKGGELAAFAFLNRLKLIKLAVSLGSTESLAEHPATMTHAGTDSVEREKHQVTENLVRLSIGVEHPDDLIRDLKQAFEAV